MKSLFYTKVTNQSQAGMNSATAHDAKTKSLYKEMDGTHTLGADGMYCPDLELPQEVPTKVNTAECVCTI